MSKKPLPRKTRVVNRGYQYSRSKEDKVKNISVTLKDIDSVKAYCVRGAGRLEVFVASTEASK